MKVAVVQHRLRNELDAEIESLASAIRRACELEAEVVVCPAVPLVVAHADQARPAILDKLQGCAEGTAVLIPFRETDATSVRPPKETPFGTTALLLGDETISPVQTEALQASPPDAIVMRPMAESELQAEAILEHAIALSVAVSGLVIVADCAGGAFAQPGHGASAIIVLGEVIAEAVAEDDVLMADISTPLSAPEPREELPSLPPILEQRLAHHQGRKPEVGYLADLS